MKVPRRQSGATGGQAGKHMIADRRDCWNVFDQNHKRARKALATRHGNHARSLTNSAWRHLARTTAPEVWDDL